MDPDSDPAAAACAPDPAPILDALRAARTVLLSGHVRPDGDCLGAQAALHGVLTSLGKEVYILNPDPPAQEFAYLAEGCPYGSWDGGDLPEHDLLVLLDVGDLQRCGPLGEHLAAAPSKKALIDHHVPAREPWWDVAYLDRTASATGLLVARLADALDVPLTGNLARGVFTSLVTDCGWFRYGNTDGETLALAARLAEGGLEPDVMYGLIYQRKPEGHPRAVGQALLTTSFHGDGRIAMAQVPRPAPGEEEHLDGDDVLDILRSVSSVEVVLLLRDQGDGTCRLSARSKTWFDVHQLAAAVGGGGHVRAAGATLDGSLEDAGQCLLKLASRQFEERTGEAAE